MAPGPVLPISVSISFRFLFLGSATGARDSHFRFHLISILLPGKWHQGPYFPFHSRSVSWEMTPGPVLPSSVSISFPFLFLGIGNGARASHFRFHFICISFPGKWHQGPYFPFPFPFHF